MFKSFRNALPIPAALVRSCAEDAAFFALKTFSEAAQELSQATRARPLSTIHGDVIRTARVATSLAQAGQR